MCTQGGECLSGICAKEVGIYFGLEADASVCMSDHCFNGRKDVGETQVDCGGTCGTECPACSVDPSFRSAEILSDWGEPTTITAPPPAEVGDLNSLDRPDK